MNAFDQYRMRVVSACAAFAASQLNDPFALRRAMSHFDNGISGIRQIDSTMGSRLKAGDPAEYRAEAYTVRDITSMGQAFVNAGMLTLEQATTKVTRYKRITVPCS
jgi:hypothetical protein